MCTFGVVSAKPLPGSMYYHCLGAMVASRDKRTHLMYVSLFLSTVYIMPLFADNGVLVRHACSDAQTGDQKMLYRGMAISHTHDTTSLLLPANRQ